MRHTLIVPALATVALLAGGQPGNAAAFCLVSSVYMGIPECTYHTWEQCRASIGGGGDYCELNLNGSYAFDVRDPAHPRVIQPPPPRKVRKRRD